MPRATHVVRSRLFHAGEWREPGSLIDASWWPTRLELEQSGYIAPLPPERQVDLVAVGRAAPAKARKPRRGRPSRLNEEAEQGGAGAAAPAVEGERPDDSEPGVPVSGFLEAGASTAPAPAGKRKGTSKKGKGGKGKGR